MATNMKLSKRQKRFISIAIDVIGVTSILVIWLLVYGEYATGGNL